MEVTGRWRKLDEEPHDLHTYPSVTTIKSKKVSWWVGRGACGKQRREEKFVQEFSHKIV